MQKKSTRLPVNLASGKEFVKRRPKDGGILSLFLNLVLPSIILLKGCSRWGWSPTITLVVALSFPLLVGCYQLRTADRFSFTAALGVVSVLLTGGISLLNLPIEWMPIKEASISGILGVYLVGVAHTKKNPIRLVLKGFPGFNLERVHSALEANQTHHRWNQLLQQCAYLIGSSFFISSALHYFITRALLQNATGTAGFVEQLGRVHLWSGVIISVPCLLISLGTLYYFSQSIKVLTGLKLEQIFTDAN